MVAYRSTNRADRSSVRINRIKRSHGIVQGHHGTIGGGHLLRSLVTLLPRLRYLRLRTPATIGGGHILRSLWRHPLMPPLVTLIPRLRHLRLRTSATRSYSLLMPPISPPTSCSTLTSMSHTWRTNLGSTRMAEQGRRRHYGWTMLGHLRLQPSSPNGVFPSSSLTMSVPAGRKP